MGEAAGDQPLIGQPQALFPMERQVPAGDFLSLADDQHTVHKP